MSCSNQENVEALLTQLPLRKPSPRLDESIESLAAESLTNSSGQHSAANGKFGWAALASTALVACLGGVLIGSFYSNKRSQDLSAPQVATSALQVGQHDVGNSSAANSNITQVRFNVQAFELLHGHSTNPDFAHCDACHDNGQQKEAFKGWYYGDDSFFKKHHAGQLGKCSSCHRLVNDANEGQVPKLKGPHDQAAFPNRECSNCHGRVSDARVPQQDLNSVS
jgi:hypothetical protein